MNVISYKPPKSVRYKGEVHKVHDSARNILELYMLLEGETDEFERAIMVVTKMFGVNAPVDDVMVAKAVEILNNGKTVAPEETFKKSTDFIQDYSVYRMDIIREYNGLDIDKDDISWGDLQHYIGNLSADSMLNTYAKIRTQDLKKVDKKELKEFKKIQNSIKLIDRNKTVEVEEERPKSIFDIYREKQKEDYRKQKGG